MTNPLPLSLRWRFLIILFLFISPKVFFFRIVFIVAGIFFTSFSGNWIVFLVFITVLAFIIDLVDYKRFDKVFIYVLSVNLVPKNFLESDLGAKLLGLRYLVA